MNPIKQIIHFAAVGLVNTMIDFLVYIVLTRLAGLDALTASLLSFLTGSLNSFFMNKRWTFRNRSRGSGIAQQYLKSLTVAVGVLGLHQICLLLFFFQMGLPDLLAKALGMGLGMAFGFILNRRWVFGLNLRSSCERMAAAMGSSS